MRDAVHWIERLQMQRHPEGGWFRETYRSMERIEKEHLPARFTGDRSFATAIYYLLQSDDFSALHRIRQDEVWHFYDGASLVLHLIAPGGGYSTLTLGRDLDSAEEPQRMVPAGWLFAATVAAPASYSLVGCTVSPGFDFADFEVPTHDALTARYPEHRAQIDRLTRE